MQNRAFRLTILSSCFVLLSGCAIHQNVTPVEKFEGKDVCVVENPAVRFNFLESFRSAMSTRGYTVKMLPANAALRECPVTITYTANWRWDLAMYMAYAEINVYKGGQPAGKAVYDASRGGANMGKFIQGDSKIAELVGQLFPG